MGGKNELCMECSNWGHSVRGPFKWGGAASRSQERPWSTFASARSTAAHIRGHAGHREPPPPPGVYNPTRERHSKPEGEQIRNSGEPNKSKI